MSDIQFDPKKFIDRTFETDLFEELLFLKDESRILAIRDLGGMGKSQLLERFHWRCRAVSPRTPVSLVDFKQLQSKEPLHLIKKVQEDLKAYRVVFPKFEYFNRARIAKNFTPFHSAIHLEASNWQGATDTRIATTLFEHAEVQQLYINATGAFTPEQQGLANDVTVQAFLQELAHHSQEQTIVLLFDTYEQRGELDKWLETDFLTPHFFDIEYRPKRLLLVLGGREIPDFQLIWGPDYCGRVVKSIDQLGKWTKTHVEECLRVNGYTYEANHVELFYTLLQQGSSPLTVLQAMREMLRTRV